MIPTFLLGLLAASAASPLPGVEHVTKISVSSRWGGLGTPRSADFAAVRVGGELRAGNRAVDPGSVRALLDAIGAPPKPALLAGDVPFGSAYDAADLFRSCGGISAYFPDVVRWWSSTYASAASKTAFLSDYYSGSQFSWDDYPHEKVVVDFDDATSVTVRSDHQQAYMLPFSVTRNGASADSYEPAIPSAIARLDPKGVNVRRLLGGDLPSAYAESLCRQQRDQTFIRTLEAYAPIAAGYVRANGLKGLQVVGGFTGVAGEVRFGSWPAKMSMMVSTSAQRPFERDAFSSSTVRSLRAAKATGDRILALPWVTTWLAAVKDPQISLSRSVGIGDRFGQDGTARILAARDPGLAAYAARDAGSVYAGLADASAPRFSEWLFLSDGRAILASYDTRETRVGPFRQAELVGTGGLDSTDRETLVVIDRSGKAVERH